MSLFDVVKVPFLEGTYLSKDAVDVDMAKISIENRRLMRTLYLRAPVDLEWEGDFYFWYNGHDDKDEHWFAVFEQGNLVELTLVPREQAAERIAKGSK